VPLVFKQDRACLHPVTDLDVETGLDEPQAFGDDGDPSRPGKEL
jgi:hypothetical protein